MGTDELALPLTAIALRKVDPVPHLGNTSELTQVEGEQLS